MLIMELMLVFKQTNLLDVFKLMIFRNGNFSKPLRRQKEEVDNVIFSNDPIPLRPNLLNCHFEVAHRQLFYCL